MAKVLLTLNVCNSAGLDLHGKEIFDYGFGAGTFYRYCSKESRLYGVEMDGENVGAVAEMLRERGYSHVDLQTIDPESWKQHPLLTRKYDVILCSHVLEHLPDPVGFLQHIAGMLQPGGVFIGLVPLNERVMDPHHFQRLDRDKIFGFAQAAGLEVAQYLESDHWMYWIQPIFTRDQGPIYKLAQAVSLGLGVVATLLGHRIWCGLAPAFGFLTRSKPTQAAFVFQKASVS